MRSSHAAGRRLRHAHACLLALLLGLSGCTGAPERIGMPGSEWVRSPNFNERRPSYVVLHHTSDDTAAETLRTLTDPLRQVSAHYLVSRDGRVYQLVDERHRAWHAGQSRWGSDPDLNSSSIGIELDNNGREPFAAAQIQALLVLLDDIKLRYRIPAANFLGHSDVSPGRKVDPSAYFPWRELALRGFGLWCDPPYPTAPPGFDAELALRALGYDTRDRAAAVHAFKLRFVQHTLNGVLSADDHDLLHCLLLARSESYAADERIPQRDWPAL
jgi:N-acetylmuramoyl-L-alanine amidase